MKLKEKIKAPNFKLPSTDNTIFELNKVKIVLNPVNFTIAVITKNPNIIVENKKINLKKINANLSLGALLKKEFSIKNARITTKENNLKKILVIVNSLIYLKMK